MAGGAMWTWLFDTSMGGPGPYGRWPTWLAIAFHGANLVMALIDLSVPLLIWSLWHHKRDGIDVRRFLLTVAFLPAMGVTRLMRACELWGAPYHLTALVDGLGAAVAILSYLTLPRFLLQTLELRSRQHLHDLLDEQHRERLAAELERLDLLERYRGLMLKFRDFEALLATEEWSHEKALALAEIKGMLASTVQPAIAGMARNGHGQPKEV